MTRWPGSATMCAIAVLMLAAACSPGARVPPTSAPLRYVALGDSYTIGTSVGAAESWPDQLVARLPALVLIGNLGVNGFTSADLIRDELARLDALRPEFFSLLIGVNDVVQGVPEESYRRNVERILDDLVGRVGPDRVLVVTTPDYTVTPAGANYGDPVRQAAAIRAFNTIESAAAEARGVSVVNIYELSLRASDDRGLVAGDGLHPSGRQYGLWVDAIVPAVEELLAR